MDPSSAPNPPEPARSERGSGRGFAVRDERERILAALVEVGAERGYEGITAERVARVAGITVDGFERHFASVEECFLAAYAAMSDVLVAHATAAFQSGEGRPWADRVTLALRALVRLLAAEAELARMPIVEVTAIPGDARVRYREALDRFIPFLEQGRKTVAGTEPPTATARLAIGGASTLIFDEFRAGRGAELEAMLPELVFAVTMPYLGAEAAEEAMRKAAA